MPGKPKSVTNESCIKIAEERDELDKRLTASLKTGREIAEERNELKQLLADMHKAVIHLEKGREELVDQETNLMKEVEALTKQRDILKKERDAKYELIEETTEERDELKKELAAERECIFRLQEQRIELRKTIETLKADQPHSYKAHPWKDINLTWSALLAASLDNSRLVGVEIELEGGHRYLIGDVNTDGGQFGQMNMAFHRDVIVKRARVMVRR